MLVFYNDAAALLLGKPFAELGEIPSGEFGETLQLSTPTGERILRRDSPTGIAFFEHKPSHQTVMATTYDGARRTYEATAYPLLGATGEMHGVVARLLAGAPRNPPADARPRVGMPRLGRGARARHGEVRRQHVVRRGAARERARARARRRHRHAPARRRDAAGPAERAARAAHPSPPRPPAGARVLPPAVRARISTSTSGDRRRRCSTSPSASRCTSRRRSSRCASRTCPRGSRSTTRPRSRCRSARRPSAPRRSRTRGRRSATGSRRTGARSCTSPTTSRHWARIWPPSRSRG